MFTENNNKLLDMKNDFVFKRVFTYPGNEEMTKHFIKLITKDNNLSNLSISSQVITEQELSNSKYGYLDIKAEDSLNSINIEIQMAKYDYMLDRGLFYGAKLVTQGIHSGDDYCKIKRNIVILILNFELDELKDINKIRSTWHIREDDYKQVILTNKLEFHIISLKRLEDSKHQIDSNDTLLLNWLHFISNSNDGSNYDMESDVNLKKAYDTLTNISSQDYERYLAELREQDIIEKNSLESSGIRKGIKKGIETGRKEEKIEIAKKLLENNVNIQIIISSTGLSKEEIENLK